MEYKAQMHTIHYFKISVALLATVLTTLKCLLQRWMVYPEVIYCLLWLIIMIPLGKMHS